MTEFSNILSPCPNYRNVLKHVKDNTGTQMVVGLSHIHKAHYIYSLCLNSEKKALVIMPTEAMAVKLCTDLNALFGGIFAHFFPARELAFRPVEGVSHEYEHARLQVLGGILSGDCPIVVTSAEGAVQYTIPQNSLAQSTHVVKQGDTLTIDELRRYLVLAGYSHSAQVEGAAQFTVRGGIVDFFSPTEKNPFRVEFWGDEIDTISTFDPATQRRITQGDIATISPAREALVSDNTAFIHLLEQQKQKLKGRYGILAKELIDRDITALESDLQLATADRYLPILYPQKQCLLDYCAGRLLFCCEPVSLKETLSNLSKMQAEDTKLLLPQGVLFPGCDIFSADYVDLLSAIERENTVILDTFPRSLNDVKLTNLIQINAIELSVWSGDYNLLKEDLASFLEQDYCIIIFAGTNRACSALCDDLLRDNIRARVVDDVADISTGSVYLVENTLSAGIEYPSIKLAILTHSRMTMTTKRLKKHKDGKKIKALSDLNIGDFVVHSSHGIGVFEGIVKREMQGIIKDYIKIRYKGTDMLFVPVTQLDLVSKYIGAGEGSNVKLNRLNSVEWNKTKARVKSAVKDMAKELTALYAKRAQAKGHPFAEDDTWQREFEERFPFEETDDQLRCVEEIKADMQKPMPMDRLLCGDVGFGKTEVALRAVFKCVMEGKQCAVLVPTTILAWQHYQTFTQRLEGYPMNVELLSRFKTAKEQEQIIRKLKRGEIDIIIGTHRIVQKDIQFKDLGLCIIDEEQRFGVAHKEKFKEMRANIDVLTLSATPIPRTLNMAMSGIRDMSLIEEAPQDRHPVQTYVMEHDDGVLAQAISKELRRGGQVFYLHNRTESIDSCAARLQDLVPEARIATAHGKMGEEMISSVWQKLVEHEVDILVCTTIIETGVDIPNCNTLVIEDADRMGLSQLYQIRGRVGRSSRRAYAYLTFHKGKTLTEIATKRLSAIREFTTFGSGFRIAMRDLEIRGAGNILGSQQHGHMESVGYDLYLKLLAEAVQEEQGGTKAVQTECLIDIRISAYIPEKYIENLSQRIDVYKKIAAIATAEDASDVLDELIDRFSDPPEPVKGLVDVALMRGTASRLGIVEITQRDQHILIYPSKLSMEVASLVASRMRGRIMVNAGVKPYFAIAIPKNSDPIDTIRETLSNMTP